MLPQNSSSFIYSVLLAGGRVVDNDNREVLKSGVDLSPLSAIRVVSLLE